MSREWKPGDVVTATVNGRPNVRVIAGWSKYDPQLRWGELSTRWADGDDDEAWFMPNQVTDHRPLVVIDPEDREQVERLEAILAGQHGWPVPHNEPRVGYMQAALRSLVADPKPEEPTGLGAVVEDAEGRRWVRAWEGAIKGKVWTQGLDLGEDGTIFRAYDGIAAVRVLAEGWSE